MALLMPEGESEQPFADLTPGDDSTIVLSVVDEGGPVRLTTGTFPRLKDHHFTKASVEDLAQPPELPMQKKVSQPTRAEKALTESFQKVSDESETAARLGYRTAGHDTHRELSDDLVDNSSASVDDAADASASTFTDESDNDALDHTMIAGFPAIAEPEDEDAVTSEFGGSGFTVSDDMGVTSADESDIEDVEDDYDYDDAYDYEDVDDDAYPDEAYAGGMFTDDDFAEDIEDTDDVEDAAAAVDDSDAESSMGMNAADATNVMEFEDTQFAVRFDEPDDTHNNGRERFPYHSARSI